MSTLRELNHRKGNYSLCYDDEVGERKLQNSIERMDLQAREGNVEVTQSSNEENLFYYEEAFLLGRGYFVDSILI